MLKKLKTRFFDDDSSEEVMIFKICYLHHYSSFNLTCKTEKEKKEKVNDRKKTIKKKNEKVNKKAIQ